MCPVCPPAAAVSAIVCLEVPIAYVVFCLGVAIISVILCLHVAAASIIAFARDYRFLPLGDNGWSLLESLGVRG